MVSHIMCQNTSVKNCNLDLRPLFQRDILPKQALYLDTTASPQKRAEDLVSRLSFDEKLTLTGGWNKFFFPGIDRLGLRPIYFSDASQGLHERDYCIDIPYSTSFPSALALAATWNKQLAFDYARAIGEECRAWGVDVLLGPGLNMYRNSEGGRNFEYFGEDPVLTSRLAVNYVKGLQSTGTIATIKHFIGNEQELARHIVNIKIGEQALHEIYLPPFLACIKEAGALAVMTGNNEINGYPGAANLPLSQNLIRKEWGFQGMIMSDWANSMYWTDRHQLELTSGHSLLMEKNQLFADYIHELLQKNPKQKTVVERELEKMVFHNLYTFFKAGVYDRFYNAPELIPTVRMHKKVALTTAEEAITLLKNQDNILPVYPDLVNNILVVGSDTALDIQTGKGSGAVKGFDHVNYLEGLKLVYGAKINRQENPSEKDIRFADVILYFLHKTVGEAKDYDFYLEPIQKEKIEKISKLNKNVVVIYSSGNPSDMPWLHSVKGLVYAYFLGQYRGIALANIISGQTNPSGKLPFTIEKEFKDSPAYNFNLMKDGNYYWGGARDDSKEIEKKIGRFDLEYKEGIFTGYRWYDKKKIETQFPFGFGLSYTTFNYSSLKLSTDRIGKEQSLTINFTLNNSGNRDGLEVCQVYIRNTNRSANRPEKELKAFEKVFLKKGEQKEIQMQLSYNDFSYWDVNTHKWKIKPGKYEIWIGSSSQNIKLKHTITLL